MTRVSLKKYYQAIFKQNNYSFEILKEINRGHAISSKYYDVQFSRESLMYRDEENQIVIPIEHGGLYVAIYLSTYYERNKCPIPIFVLQNRITSILTFLEVRFQFE